MEECQEVHLQNNLQCCIKSILLDANSSRLTNAFLVRDFGVSEDLLVRLLRNESQGQTLDQLRAVAKMFFTQWMKAGATQAHVKYAQQPTIFNMLLHFVDNGILHEGVNGDPVCQWEGLLRWNDLTNQIGEDVMTCAYLAGHDLRTEVPKRVNFNWIPFLRTDDPTLNMLLELPLADVHAHLKGSSLNFDINWICLMNHISQREKAFTYLAKNIQSDHADECQDEDTLYKKAVLAAIIRLYLLEMSYFKRSELITQLLSVMNCHDASQIISEASVLQSLLDDAQKRIGMCYTSSEGDSAVFDYAIIQGVNIDHVDSYTILSGERYIIYSMLKMIYSGECTDYRMKHLLLLYLVIKNEVRHEIIQLNDSVGFDNFNIFELRKLIFVDDYKDYKNAALHLAIKGFFGDINPDSRYHEVRVVPKDTGRDIIDDIKKLDNAIESNLLNKDKNIWNYRYIFHFIKRPDDLSNPECRHYALRASVKKKAEAIYNFRNSLEQNNRGVFYTDRVVGIDAANSEIACRPEVFAQAFRFLRQHSIKYPNMHRPKDLGVTYHVGEDFMDVIDGLRAVTEAISFLQLRKGDRIGHGLVLGVDVSEYYQSRNCTVTMSLQMLMDNMAWLYHYIRCLKGYNDLMGTIKEKYGNCYRRIYEGHQVPSIDLYYSSMLLRGDNPECYKADGTIVNQGSNLSEWLSQSLNSNRECNKVRELRDARKLYHQYHYDQQGKQNGNVYTEWVVCSRMIEAIKIIQTQLLDKVEELGLAIECNPTSNIKIGEFNRYDEHPILRFNNEGLGYHPHKALSVSINTDDSGVFATSIDREYALIAHSLIRYFRQNKRDVTDHDVYNWLDRIRQQSLSQRFDKSDVSLDNPRMDTIEKFRQHILNENKNDIERKHLSLFSTIRRWWSGL